MDDSFVNALVEADQVMVGIRTKRGPHVTPELFTVSAGRIWCLTAASTLKARLLADGGHVAVAARTRRGAVAALGEAVLLDAAHPTKALAAMGTAARGPIATSRFLLDNAAELSGAVTDFFAGRLGSPLPPRRVLVGIEVSATLVVEGDDVVHAEGWSREAETAEAESEQSDGAVDLIESVPDNLRDLAASGPCFLGWTTASGEPLVLPAEWDHDARTATLTTGVAAALGPSASSPASLTRDSWSGYGPSGKQGLMLRGRGSLAGDQATVTVDSVTYWDGVEVGRVGG